jgi:8-amino-7-oxononanoate synthase
VETLYSMDGDQAPLRELAALAHRHDAMLLLDEAHCHRRAWRSGQGVGCGYEGRPQHHFLAYLRQGSGALPARWSVCRACYRDFMVNRGRSFIYSTAPSPLMAAVVRSGLKISAGAEQERAQLRNWCAMPKNGCAHWACRFQVHRSSLSFWAKTAVRWRWRKPCRRGP